jgi:1-acyl-sn-glycerol-3-phosphate acyltransferase
MSDLTAEIRGRVDRLELPFGASGIDPYGVSKEKLAQAGMVLGGLYRHYFKIKCFGIENIPTRGKAMLVANHSGGYAVDAGMLAAACFFEMEPPRLAHGMAEKFIAKLPFLSDWANRVGQLTGLPQHARRLLDDDRLLMVFPEGVKGTAKLYRDRYSLVQFGTGFVRLAMETRTPVVPTAVLGGGEAVPTIANLKWLGRLLGAPYIPITPYLFALPLPVNIEFRFGEPMLLEGTGQESDEEVGLAVEQVRERIRSLIDAGRKEYRAL